MPPVALVQVERTPLPSPTTFSVADLATPSLLTGLDPDAGGQGLAAGGGDGSGAATGKDHGSGAPMPDVLMKANWVVKPTEEAVSAFTPMKARARHKSGDAIIACRVMLSTRVHDCRIVAESASGFGFGSAAIAASRIFRIYPPRRNGAPVKDAWVAIPVLWISKPPPDPKAAKQAVVAGPTPTDPPRRQAGDLSPTGPGG